MPDRTSQESVDALIEQLTAACDDRGTVVDCTRLLAILWTWLELHMAEFGSLRISAGEIRVRAKTRRLGAVHELQLAAAELQEIRDAPLLAAAELLARVADAIAPGRGTPTADQAYGFDGVAVVTVWKAPDLAIRLGRRHDASPPASMEHPTLEALAPRLAVCRRVVANITLDVKRPKGRHATAMALGLASGAPDTDLFAVHLDPLEHHGMSGWHPEPGGHVGWFDPGCIDRGDEARARKAAKLAVVEASGSASVLVMPELAATPRVLATIKKTLRRQGKAPVLTVVGLYHGIAQASDLDAVLVGSADPATRVNEAVVLNHKGVELWRHRKLSKAQAEVDTPAAGQDGRDGEPELVIEDVVPGRSLTIVPTSIGVVCVVICLDSFKQSSRARLAASGADLVLVPSLSPSVTRHRTSLQHLVQGLWGAAFVCNREFPGDGLDGATPAQLTELWNGPRARSFWAMQRGTAVTPDAWAPPRRHPSFVCRTSD